MIEPSELDIAQIKHDMRTMYKHVGFDGALQVLYEMMYASRVLAEIIMEERSKDEVC